MLYQIIQLLRGSRALAIVTGLGILTFLYFFSRTMGLYTLNWLLQHVFSSLFLVIVVIFQEDIRMFFYRIGSRFSSWKIFRPSAATEDAGSRQQILEITQACRHMASTKTGALIVLAGGSSLKEIVDTGERLDAQVSARLIENIFFKNTPLHDGALVIREGKMLAAACILPVSKNQNIPLHYGLRHRAALGLTEKSDATCIVVSEETGRISVAEAGEIREVKEDDLFLVLHSSAATAPTN